MKPDLTPFGFTPTESLVYGALLRLGPATGYAVARAARLARANAYAALEGLVSRGAAAKAPGRPARFRPADPRALLVDLAARQGDQLERLSASLRAAAVPADPDVRIVSGSRALATTVQHVVARAQRLVVGVLAASLWRPTLPAWRRAAARATLQVRLAGPGDDPDGLASGAAPDDHPTILLVDDAQALLATAGASGELEGVWSTHPAVLAVARTALGAGS